MMPRELIDRAKALAREKTGIPTDRMLISATHTHSAPSAMGALGTPPDADYAAILPGRIAEAIERAAANLEPARVGWGVVDDPEHTFCRRWIRRPDRMLDDPFGQRTVRANMHPGYQNPDAIAPSGPVDPALTVLSVQSPSGRPIAVLANYSMHYYGADAGLGRLLRPVRRRAGPADRGRADGPATARSSAIMSQGTSGDQMWMDYGRPKKDPGLDAYADAVAASAERAYRSIAYRDRVPLAMAETTLDPRPPRPRRGPAGLGPGASSPRWRTGRPADPARGLRQGGDLPARRARPRAEAPGDPDRRAGHRRDPQRGLRHHRA